MCTRTGIFIGGKPVDRVATIPLIPTYVGIVKSSWMRVSSESGTNRFARGLAIHYGTSLLMECGQLSPK